jgi:hypothetical protein
VVLAVGQAGALAALDLLDPLSSGRDRLAALRERLTAVETTVILKDGTQADEDIQVAFAAGSIRLDGAGRGEVQRFTAGVAAEAMGRPVRVYPLSARQSRTVAGTPCRPSQ